MENQVKVMERETEELRQSISHKLELIQGRISTIKDRLDLKKQTEAKPLAMVGGALLTGCVLGCLSSARRPPKSRPLPASPRASTLGSFLSRVSRDYGEELGLVKKMAVAAALRYGQRRLTRPSPDA